MAFNALKPCSRIMRTSPHQSDEQQKEAYNLLLQEEEQEVEEEEAETPHRKSLNFCEDPLIKQLLSSSKLSSDPASPNDLPTFIAPQGLHSLQLPHKKSEGHHWFAKNDHNYSSSRHLVPLCEDEAFTQSFLHPPDFHSNRVCTLLQPKPRKQNSDELHHSKQKFSYKKSATANNSMYGLALEQTLSVRDAEAGGEKKRHSSASARDLISRKESGMSYNRFCDAQSSSWEEEVRQAMAKNSLINRQSEEACRGGVGCGLQRSISVKEYGISELPPTLIVKRTNGHGKVDAAICTEESGAKLIHDTVVGIRAHRNKGAAEEKRMWKGFNVVKSPSEERWEEAAQDEERQEMQRRARSQSMRYDTTSLSTSELAGISRPEALVGGNALHNDDEWAVYTRSGYINVRPRRSDADAMQPCCSSLMGRSLSMRDTRMGLVMECAACGTALDGSGGHLLCFCSCCAAARASTRAGTPASHKKKGGGGGILRACRRLLGLSKKRP